MMTSQLLKEIESLNPQQKKAVMTPSGKVLILAGAGTGKTRVLTLRMAYLMEHCKVSPKAIVGLTFTNKAAAEMRHRLAQWVSPAIAKQLKLCTFHSFCMQVLRADIHHLGYTSEFSIYNEKDVERLVKRIARDMLDHEGELPSLAPTLAAIAKAKSQGIPPEALDTSGGIWHDSFIKTVYQRLHHSLRAYNAVDFDHLLWLVVELFESHPTILEKYQERHPHIMIDEYQDTNPLQSRLATLLSAKSQNLCVVGDDDQSIYGWRGAKVRFILDFDASTTIKLEQNYRSTQTILEGANAVISHNQSRHSKTLWSDRGKGALIHLFHAPTEEQEAEAVVYRLQKWKEQLKLQWKDFAILYRSNALSRAFEMALLKVQWQDVSHQWIRGIPYQIFGGVEFYERREIQDLFAYLRVIANPRDQEALLRIINQPRRGIGEGLLDTLTRRNRQQEIPLWQLLQKSAKSPEEVQDLLENANEKTRKGVRQFVEVVEEGQRRFQEASSLVSPLKWLIDTLPFKKAIEEDVKSQRMRQMKWENVEEFVNTVSAFEQQSLAHQGPRSLADFIATFPLQNGHDFAPTSRGKEDCVQLMTFHSAKGLEFPVCFLVGMEDHLMPHEKSLSETDIEEERRLMYVAMTRAKQLLNLSMSKKRKRMGKEHPSLPSRFLYEIPKELLQITPWDS